MDIQFNNLRQEKDAIGVIFCDNKCRLIGYGKKLDQLSKKYISNIIKSDISFQERNSKHFDYSIIHQPANLKLSKLYVFKLKNFKDYQIRDFQTLGGHLNSLIKFYKETTVIVYPDGISSTKVGSLNAISEMILGMSLASYSFTKYFSKKDDKKNKNKTKKKKVKIYSSQHTRLAKNYESISAIHQGVTLTRNLVTEPPNVMTPPKIAEYAKDIQTVVNMGCQVAIVIGGGNIFRGVQAANSGMDRVQGDYMGMLATVINGLALQSSLENIDVKTRLMSAIKMDEVAEPFIRRRAVRHLEKGRVVIFSAGTGNPYFTTDTAATLRAIEVEADVILKGTRVDGIYTADPEKDTSATKYDTITFDEVYKKGLNVMDMTAFTLCNENKLPIMVFNMNTPGNLFNVVNGEEVGTLVNF